ncbi:hypothetical protein CCP3SC1_210013 [Gammaproteobacteria bacterium]
MELLGSGAPEMYKGSEKFAVSSDNRVDAETDSHIRGGVEHGGIREFLSNPDFATY